jgi:nicotinamide mononucleotide transporter
LTALEIIAVIMAVGYLLLAIRENIWCWACAGISTAIYIGLFIDARLYMESALNAFYFAMAIYGWHVWRSGRADGHERPVVTWPMKSHAVALAAIVAASASSGYLLDTRTDAVYPYIDSLTTWSAIWATFLVARKVLENWWYWLVIDVASVFIYWSRELELTAALFVLYVVLIPFGIVSWTRSWKGAQQWA